MKIKKILGLSLVLGCLISTTAFASYAVHGRDVSRFGLYAAGSAHTSWDRPHCTKISIGTSSSTTSGTRYSQTDVIDGWGIDSSEFWSTT